MNVNKLLVFLVLWVASAPLVKAEATFHGNNARTGVYDAAGPKTLKGVKWTFKTGGPIFAS